MYDKILSEIILDFMLAAIGRKKAKAPKLDIITELKNCVPQDAAGINIITPGGKEPSIKEVCTFFKWLPKTHKYLLNRLKDAHFIDFHSSDLQSGVSFSAEDRITFIIEDDAIPSEQDWHSFISNMRNLVTKISPEATSAPQATLETS